MSEWLIALISSSALAVMLTWAFQWGKRGGKVNTRSKELERRANNPQILPECSVIFTEIKENLSNLNGKVDTLVETFQLIAKERQKNDEREHTQGKEKE